MFDFLYNDDQDLIVSLEYQEEVLFKEIEDLIEEVYYEINDRYLYDGLREAGSEREFASELKSSCETYLKLLNKLNEIQSMTYVLWNNMENIEEREDFCSNKNAQDRLHGLKEKFERLKLKVNALNLNIKSSFWDNLIAKVTGA